MTGVAADLLWIGVLSAMGLLGMRYIERLPSTLGATQISGTAVGYIALVAVAFALSLLRAWLHKGTRTSSTRSWQTPRDDLIRQGVHSLTYVLFAIVSYLALTLILGLRPDPVLLIPLCIGALLPDLDTRDSLPGRLFPGLAQRLEKRFGHRQEWHSLGAAALAAILTAPMMLLTGPAVWEGFVLGFVSHLLLDLVSTPGIMMLWPLRRTRYQLFRGILQAPGSRSERRLTFGLALAALVLFALSEAANPAPAPTTIPTFEEAVDRYYELRGKNLVYADLEGTWQASGRRVTDRFEVLNARGQSFVMLEPFTGKVFTAGQSATDNLYLNRIRVWPGAPARVKAVEVSVRDGSLAEVLPLVYEMQKEPGLEHIYVSGDILVPESHDGSGPMLSADYSQTTLRKIQPGSEHPPTGEQMGTNHWTLAYLTAAELVELANLKVDSADLVIVGTYSTQIEGPTATPLPSPQPVAGESEGSQR
jgi:membrane-bound metal-dependent hydrolase YbcI (DUF457 family)